MRYCDAETADTAPARAEAGTPPVSRVDPTGLAEKYGYALR